MSDSTFNILSFDGGGIRGALSIKLLEKIQNETPNIVKKSNMISGTSTGSLIALGLAYGMTPSEISNLYSKENLEYIFDKSYSQISRPKYDNNHLKEILLSVFPENVYIQNWEQEANIKDLEFLDVVKQYAKYEKELKENCDFIIVCYHGGFEKSLDENMTPTEALTKENQGSELLENFDSINMILSGHQHRSFITKIKDVICSQPMHNGQSFTKVVIDTESNDISYELIDVSKLNDDIDDKLENIFTQTQKDLEVYLDKIIGEFDKDIKVDDIFLARLKGHPFINFLHQVQLDVSGADFSALSVFDSAMGFSKKISVRDVLINYPYPNTLKVLEVTGEKLKEAIEKSATYFVIEDGKIGINKEFLHPKVQHYNYDTFGGLEYKIDLSRDFYDRVVYMKKMVRILVWIRLIQ